MSSSLTSMTTRELVDAFASNAPTPGGGSAAALSGAIGAALLGMVAGLPKTRTGDASERTALDAAGAALTTRRTRLVELTDEDTRAYDLVTAAFKHPKTTDEEKAARKTAIQSAMRAATEAPLETMRACEAALAEARVVAASGNPSAASDVYVGVQMVLTGLKGAEKNVAINLDSLKDETFREQARDEAAQLLASGSDHASASLAAIAAI